MKGLLILISIKIAPFVQHLAGAEQFFFTKPTTNVVYNLHLQQMSYIFAAAL
jgi:hypothetical protein